MNGCVRAEPSSKFRDGPAIPSPAPTDLANMRGIVFPSRRLRNMAALSNILHAYSRRRVCATIPALPSKSFRNARLTKHRHSCCGRLVHAKIRCKMERLFSVRSPQATCPIRVCAVKRRRVPVGASPTRRPLQPEATGAGMEVTKCLKPSDSGSRNTVTARVCRPQRE